MRLEGREAVERADDLGLTLTKAADASGPERSGLSVEEATKLLDADEDAPIYVDVPDGGGATRGSTAIIGVPDFDDDDDD